MVQHPTLAQPFLDNDLIVDCNATKGFDQSNIKKIFSWPYVELPDGNAFDLRTPRQCYNSVYSFIADPSEEYDGSLRIQKNINWFLDIYGNVLIIHGFICGNISKMIK